MDSYRDIPVDFDLPSTVDSTPDDAVAAEIGTDERRMHVRAYNYWVSLLDGRDYPSIEDLEPGDVRDFADHSILLDFTAGRDNPAVPYVGAAIRVECGLEGEIGTIDDVPSRSLLSRLTDHYMQIIANRAPVGFEAEFDNQRSETICYRGILMPFSSDGETIDFIYGVINWKKSEEHAAASPTVPFAQSDHDEMGLLSLDDPIATIAGPTSVADPVPAVHVSWDDGPLHDDDSDNIDLPELVLDEEAGLADRLWAARESAEAVKAADGRSRTALYRTLSLAYDLALQSEEEPDDYAELLEESGMKAQARAPMTPIVKLVFGVDYDKARLTEFAAALSYARREAIARGGFQALIEAQAGGLKALVAAERQARRPAATPNKTESARERLRQARPIAMTDIRAESEFALVLTRRRDDGGVDPIALVEDESLIERALRSAGR